MSSFIKDINGIVNDLKNQLNTIEPNKLPSIVIKCLLLADKIKGLNDDDKKIIVKDCILELFGDDKMVQEYMPLVDDLLDNLIEEEHKSSTSRGKGCVMCDNIRCCEIITCRIMGILGKKPSDVN